ncbi:hypothetical protein EHF33_14710 [Deinococcus psychrotolerans]|uniref:Uncharacterized protein n=1 Tax=Deinococcus psychrotolerans TaxID=2489213 RepID=A0A3G8YFT1_9DEIO|nr:hypothetical protein [Deinococcus psychrotolerans]AZI44152.1 hypothetical protein EHF33_14710 [Deinococcus psychrotolerans]
MRAERLFDQSSADDDAWPYLPGLTRPWVGQRYGLFRLSGNGQYYTTVVMYRMVLSSVLVGRTQLDPKQITLLISQP